MDRAKWWIEVALTDCKRARRSLEESDFAASTFWAQQAVEKALKSLLLMMKGSFPKTHNIKKLREALGNDLNISEDMWEEAYELTQYYFVSRYPDLVEGDPNEVIGRKRAESAYRACEEIVRRAKEALEELTQGD